MEGILVTTHPGGQIVYHKKYTTNFGLTSSNKWEPWNLAALLSAIQLYASNLTSEWPNVNETAKTSKTSNTTITTTSKPASLSYFHFQNSTIHFWHHQTVTSKTGILVAVVFPGQPSLHHIQLTKSIATAFNTHCHNQIPVQPVRGFSSPLRNVLGQHLDYLMECFALHLQLNTIQIPKWFRFEIKLPTPPPSSNKNNKTRPPIHSNNTKEIIEVAPSKPDIAKGKRPNRRFLGFFRSKKKKAVIPTSTSTSIATSTLNSSALSSPQTETCTDTLLTDDNTVEYWFTSNTIDSTTSILTRTNQTLQPERIQENQHQNQSVMNHPNIKISSTNNNVNTNTNTIMTIRTIPEDDTNSIFCVQSTLATLKATLTFPWDTLPKELNKLETEEKKKTSKIQFPNQELLQHILAFATFLATRTKHR